MGAHHKPVVSGTGTGLRIRMYRVGFGDFFLVSVPTAADSFAHILVDCGVHAHDLGVMGEAVAQLKKDTGGKLALVIMTHRHADHISGFGSEREVFETFTVERVWMSWFEDPKDGKAARIQAGIAATAVRLQAALAARAGPADAQYLRMAGNALGAAASGNAAALEMLHSFRTPDGKATPVDYYTAGDKPTLPASLAGAGLEAEIVGPPKDLALVAKMDNAAHQYLAEGEDPDAPVRAGGRDREPFHCAYRVEVPDYAWPGKRTSLFPDRQVRDNVAAMQPDLLAAAAGKADNALNNQSLVVLFTFRSKTMLFAGDAQWGNWANFLFGGAIGTRGHAELTPRSKQILGKLDFYKVGHHGSRNATPIDFVEAMKKGCVAMCSTDPGAYNEVPREPLMDALLKQTEGKLARSDQVGVGDKEPTTGLGAPAAPFQASGNGVIDYWL